MLKDSAYALEYLTHSAVREPGRNETYDLAVEWIVVFIQELKRVRGYEAPVVVPAVESVELVLFYVALLVYKSNTLERLDK